MRHARSAWIWIVPAVAGIAAPLPADDSRLDASEDRVALLIEQLGSDQFTIRETAMRQLIQLGEAAMPRLREVSSHDDREVRTRARKILEIVRRDDLERRLAAFWNGSDRDSDRLPGWTRYREIAGDSVEARALYVEMVRADPELMMAVGQGGDTLAERMARERPRLVKVPVNNVAQKLVLLKPPNAMVLLLADVVRPDGTEPLLSTSLLLYRSVSVLATTSHGSAQRKLMGAWVRRAPVDEFTLTFSLNNALVEGLDAATRTIREAKEVTVVPREFMQRKSAVLLVARFGDESHIPLLESLLEDTSKLAGARRAGTAVPTEIRDVALLALAHLTKQDLDRYGLKHVPRSPQTVFVVSNVTFASNEGRTNAIRAWRERVK